MVYFPRNSRAAAAPAASLSIPTIAEAGWARETARYSLLCLSRTGTAATVGRIFNMGIALLIVSLFIGDTKLFISAVMQYICWSSPSRLVPSKYPWWLNMPPNIKTSFRTRSFRTRYRLWRSLQKLRNYYVMLPEWRKLMFLNIVLLLLCHTNI